MSNEFLFPLPGCNCIPIVRQASSFCISLESLASFSFRFCRLRGKRLGGILQIGRIELREIARDTLLELLPRLALASSRA
jgi:hypothetical protein